MLGIFYCDWLLCEFITYIESIFEFESVFRLERCLRLNLMLLSTSVLEVTNPVDPPSLLSTLPVPMIYGFFISTDPTLTSSISNP